MGKLKYAVITIVLIFSILLIPESGENNIEVAQQTQFLWNRDSLWYELEEHFTAARDVGCGELNLPISSMIDRLSSTLDSLESMNPEPEDMIFEKLQHSIFETAPLVASCTDFSVKYISLISRSRNIIKRKSEEWNPNETDARNTLYKIIYGGRAAAEEVILQSDSNSTTSIMNELDEPSATPFTTFLGIKIHSGDILISRGGAPTSALIARGSDYPGNFSHVALVYLDPQTNIASIIESHIEVGVAVASLEDYIKDKKLRVMVLRLRSDLPEIIADPMLPHKAAKASLDRALREHIPYDFEMDFKDSRKLFCSEVASSVYREFGVNLWMGRSTISSKGTAELLAGFGVKHFETQEPSDLEYDPQLSVIAEWRDIETLYNDHIDNAVVDAILEWSEVGNKITIDWYMLPIVRAVKLYSVILNQFDSAGPVPEGMSATSALRHEAFKTLHEKIKEYVLSNAEVFRSINGYIPPYWRLLEMARKYLKQNFLN